VTRTKTSRTSALVPHALWQRAAVRHLKKADPVLERIIERVGPNRFGARAAGSHLDALVRSIVGQQLSTSAATTIHGRLLVLVGEANPLPEDWLALNDPDMRAAGLSRQKIAYIRDLARHVKDGELPMDRLHLMSDDEVIEALTAVKGIGVWTAQMFLMFRLGRPDILPVLDLGIRNAFRRAYKLRKDPTAKRMQALAKSWAPYRSVASWYLWQSLELPLVDNDRA
jgi:DNA-3-methyladenine glycosylase II